MTRVKPPGEIFKEARLRKGWTQVEVTEKAGLGDNTYPKIERGISKPSPDSIKKLVRVLDIDPAKVLHLL